MIPAFLKKSLPALALLVGWAGVSPSLLADAAPGSAQAALEAFQAALMAGDTAAATRWLSADLLVYEQGVAEHSLAEYAAHHLEADIAFLKTASVELLRQRVQEFGEVAIVSSESRIRPGPAEKGKKQSAEATGFLSAETALLRKTPEGWRISHLHWSTQPRRK